MLISEDLKNALIAQWAEERENAQIYLYAGGWLKVRGFGNIGNFFIKAKEEEEGHAMQIFDLLMDLNIPFTSSPLLSGEFPINSLMDISQKFINREIQTTESLCEIKKISCEEESPASSVVEELIRKMISQQQNELEEATDFMDKSKIFDDWKSILLWDLEFK
jgi:ferritin